jgi:NADPH:quinone reductase-like Zn-dependent oxidoreductase
MDLVVTGALEVPIDRVFAFADVHAMYARLASRQVAGKLLLRVGG